MCADVLVVGDRPSLVPGPAVEAAKGSLTVQAQIAHEACVYPSRPVTVGVRVTGRNEAHVHVDLFVGRGHGHRALVGTVVMPSDEFDELSARDGWDVTDGT